MSDSFGRSSTAPAGPRPVAEPGLVSVITPFLDAAPYLEQAIASVEAQSYERWELLLVDDGSRDDSTAIALAHARRLSGRVRVLEHPGRANRGISASRNLGIAHARGEYVGFLDADDVWLPDKLTQQVAILGAEPWAAMVYGATEYWHSWRGIKADGPDRRVGPSAGESRLVQPPNLLLAFLEFREPLPAIGNPLVHRDALRATGGFENAFTGHYEDQVFLAKICLRHPVWVSGECWDRYRQRPDSLTASTTGAERAESARSAYLRWLKGYLTVQGCEDDRVWRALRRHELRRGRRWRVWRRLVRSLHAGGV